MKFEERLKICCIDDEPEILDNLSDLVRDLGYTPQTFSSPHDAAAAFQTDTSNIILIISDFKMPGLTGLELRKQCFEETKNIPFLIHSGHISREEALSAIEFRVSGFLEKPFMNETLKAMIESLTKDTVAALRDDYEMLQAFLSDADSLVEQIEELLLSLESDPENIEVVNQIFAVAHTIKGSSGFIKPDVLHRFTHRYEDFLSTYKKTATPVPPAAITILLKGLDVIKDLIQRLRNLESTAPAFDDLVKIFQIKSAEHSASATVATQTHKKTTGPQARDEIRVSMKLLDEFMELSGEITVIRNMINKLVRSIEKENQGNKDVHLLSELLEEMHKINSRMQEKIIDIRKVSMKTIVRPLPRTLRDVASTLNKDVRLEIIGDELRVDNTIAEVLGNSLVHMIRNGADHAIESPEERKRKGKNPQGFIRISSAERGEHVVVTIEDDGKGINHEVVKAKAIEKGVVSIEQAAKMSIPELQALVFESGFSTAAKVTDVSGRGVGMDMVMKEVTKIGGKIELQSTIDKGSRFDLCLPIPKTVNIIGALLVKCAGQIYCFPQDDVSRLLSPSSSDLKKMLRRAEGSDFLNIDGEIFPIMNLADVLKGQGRSKSAFSLRGERESTDIVLVKLGTTSFGVIVDTILDMEDVVVKNLATNFRAIGIFSGATFLGDGRVGMILKTAGLAELSGISLDRSNRTVSDGVTNSDQIDRSNWKETVLFNLNAPGNFGIHLDHVFRLERFSCDQIQTSGDQPVVIYRNSTMPIFDIAHELGLSRDASNVVSQAEIPALIIKTDAGLLGFAVSRITDLQLAPPADPLAQDHRGILGAAILNEKTITLLDTEQIAKNIRRRLGADLPLALVSSSESTSEENDETLAEAA